MVVLLAMKVRDGWRLDVKRYQDSKWPEHQKKARGIKPAIKQQVQQICAKGNMEKPLNLAPRGLLVTLKSNSSTARNIKLNTKSRRNEKAMESIQWEKKKKHETMVDYLH